MAYNPSDRAGAVFGELIGMGYPKHVAAALTGNIIQESGHKVRTDAVGDGGAAYGMVQWNGPRKQRFLKWAEDNGLNPADMKAQVRYLDHELRTTESGALRKILATDNLHDATRVASDAFWRPGVPMMNNRLRYAEGVANKFGDGNIRLAADTGTMTDGYSRAEIEAEMKRRGLIPKTPQTETGYSRDEIEQEMRRRGLLSSPDNGAMKEAVGNAINQMNAEDAGAVGANPAAVMAGTAALAPRPMGAAGAGITAAAKAMDPNTPVESNPIKPTDLLAVSPPGAALALIRRQLSPYWQSFFDQAIKGSSMGWSDELTGAANALVNRNEGETFGQAYGRAAGNEREAARRFAEENPYAAGAAEIGGAVLGGLPFGGAAVGAAKGTIPKVAAGAAEGGAFGALYGAGDANGGDRLAGAAEGAVGGAIAGGVLTRAGISLDRFMAARAAAKAAPTVAQAKAAAGQMIDAAEKTGIVYAPTAVRSLYDDIAMEMADNNMTKGLHKKTVALLKGLEREFTDPASFARPMTLSRIARLRTLAGDAAMEAKPGGADARLARMVRDRIDDFMVDESKMIAAGTGAAERKAGAAAWHQAMKAERIQDALEMATLRVASTGSGGNINNAIRQEFRKILTNKKAIAGFTPAEREAIRRVVDQGLTADAVRLIGKISPGGNGLMMALNLGAAGATGGASLFATGIGAASKDIADRITSSRARNVLTTILNGGTVPQSRIMALTTTERRAIVNALAAIHGQDIGKGVVDAIPAAPETAR